MHFRFAFSLALASALATAPAALADDAPKGPDLQIESYRLPNGLKVALHRDPAVPRVTVCVAYHVGAKNERARRTGFAHFFEHMMFRGTENVPNYDIPLQEAGAQSNAFTSEDMTVYFEAVPSEYLERALYLEAERLGFLPSALDQEKFDTEREVVKNERRQRNENVPYGLADETLLAAVFPAGHPYSWSVIGSMKDLGAATLDDLKAFFSDYYHPANATLTLVGDFDPDAARGLIEKYFGPLNAGPVPSKVEAPPSPTVSKRIEQADRVQLPRVYFAWPSVADDHPDAPALGLLGQVLSGGDASRLHKALVLDQKVADDVGAGSDAREIAGLFTAQATAAPGVEPEKLEAALETEFAKLADEPPTADELARALATFEKAIYAQMTTQLGRAVTIATGYAQKDDPNYYKEDIARYFEVTPEDLARVASKYLTPEKVVLWVKPGTEETPAVQAGPKPTPDDDPIAAVDRSPAGGPDWSKMPGPGEAPEFTTPKVVRRRLVNGVELWAVEWHTLPLVQFNLLIPAGTADDPEGHAGLAELAATMLDKGTESKTATELTEAFETLGVNLRVGAGLDETAVGFSALARQLDPALELVAEVLTAPRLDPEDFDRERGLQLTSLLRGPDNPSWIAQRAFRVLLYGADHPYGTPPDGDKATVEALTLDDVKAFYRDRYTPQGSIVIVVGDVDADGVANRLNATIGRWRNVGAARRPVPKVDAPTKPGVVYLVDKPAAVQSIVSVGRRWEGRKDERYLPTLVGNRVLGGDFLSRLNQNLREKNGFTYGAGSYFSFRRDGSVWAVRTSVRADATVAALREVINELDALAGDRPFTEEELGTAIGAEAQSYPDNFESPGAIAGVLSDLARFDLPPSDLETFLDRLRATGPEAVLKAMGELIAPEARVVLIVGDRASLEPKLQELGFDTIEVLDVHGKPIDPDPAGG